MSVQDRFMKAEAAKVVQSAQEAETRKRVANEVARRRTLLRQKIYEESEFFEERGFKIEQKSEITLLQGDSTVIELSVSEKGFTMKVLGPAGSIMPPSVTYDQWPKLEDALGQYISDMK